MIKKISVMAALACAMVLPAQVQAADSGKTHQFELRVECRKNDSGGCTARAVVCENAPSGYFFGAGQESKGVDAGSFTPGHAPYCEAAKPSGTGVPVAGGFSAQTSVCALLHGESGSGGKDIGKVFYTKCKYTAQIYKLP